MSNLVSKIETLFLQEPLEAICGASVVFLATIGNTLSAYNDVRSLADSAVNSALTKIVDSERRAKVLEVLPQVSGVLNSNFLFML